MNRMNSSAAKPGVSSRPGARVLSTIATVVSCVLVGAVHPAVSAADAKAGGRLYRQYCIDCHGGNGRGAVPGVPDLARGSAQMRSDKELVQKIEIGSGTMPSFLGVIRDDDLYDLVAYLRGFL